MPTHSDGRSSTTLSTTHSNPEACWSSILQPIVLALDRIYDFLDIPKPRANIHLRRDTPIWSVKELCKCGAGLRHSRDS